MRIVRSLIVVAILLLVGTVITSVFLINSDSARIQAQTTLSEILDREVSIGRHEVTLGKIISLRLDNVQIAAPAWSQYKTFAALGHLAIEVDLTDLLKARPYSLTHG